MNATPLSAGDVVTLITNVIQRTRAASQAELYQALNYGMGKAIRALSAIRPQHFASFVDPFTILAQTAEYDISNYNPPLFRPHRLVVTGNAGKSPVLLFSYREMTSREFEDAETSVAGISSTVFYDIVEGMLPSTTTTTVTGGGGAPAGTTLPVADTTLLQTGALLTMPIGGAVITPNGWALAVPQPYQGFVISASTLSGAGTLTVDPPFGVAVPAPTVVTPVRRRILYLAPTVAQSYSGRLWYVYDPPRLAAASDLFPIALNRHVDMVVAYALAFLKRGMDDAMEARHQIDATEQRAELMQDEDPMSGQNSTALGTDLDPVVGY
jgi:hypothetical protein